MSDKMIITDQKEIDALERMIEFTTDRVEILNLENTTNLLRIARISLRQESEEGIELDQPNVQSG